jgi:Concanavalin A-like lectin/glucanases superfamily
MRRRTLLQAAGLSLWALARPGWASGPNRVVGLVDMAQPLNRRHPLAKNLKAWWRGTPEQHRSSVWVDLVRRQRGVLNSMALPPTATSGLGPTTRRGGSFEARFDGTGWINCGADARWDFANTAFLLSGWCRATGAGVIIGRRSISFNNGGYFVRVDSGQTLTVRLLTVNGATDFLGYTTVTAGLLSGAWFHFAVGLTTNTAAPTGNSIVVAVNGVMDTATQSSLPATGYAVQPADALTLGSSSEQAAGTFLTGALDDLRIYQPQSLTARMARQLYQHSLLGAPGLLQELPQPVGQAGVAVAGLVKHRSRWQ